MQGEIIGLRAEAGKRGQVRVQLAGGGSFTLTRAVASRLGLGQHLDRSAVDRLRRLDRQERAAQHALRLLSRRPRSEHELRLALRRRGLGAAEVESVVERLRQGGWLEDLAFARAWIENRQTFRPRSARALRFELRQKGIDSGTIEQALEGFDEAEAAEAAARIGARRFAALPEDAFRRRLSGYLSRRGFAHSMTAPLLRRMWRQRRLGEVVEESEGPK